jgi:hypothetical protein
MKRFVLFFVALLFVPGVTDSLSIVDAMLHERPPDLSMIANRSGSI